MKTRTDKPFALGPLREFGEVGGGARDDVLLQLEDDAAEGRGGVAAAELEIEVGLGVVLLVVGDGKRRGVGKRLRNPRRAKNETKNKKVGRRRRLYLFRSLC